MEEENEDADEEGEDEDMDESDIEDDIGSEDQISFKQSSSEEDRVEEHSEEGGEDEMSEQSSPSEEEAKVDVQETTKQIRSVLNKVSEGNIDPMFKELLKVVDQLMGQHTAVFFRCYSQIFN